jgi:hypothetical protein
LVVTVDEESLSWMPKRVAITSRKSPERHPLSVGERPAHEEIRHRRLELDPVEELVEQP